MRLALYQPDIPPNLGSILRLCACLGVPADVIEPCGFPFSHAQLKRAGLDYLPQAAIVRHTSFEHFREAVAGRRLVLASTRGETSLHAFAFRPGDVLMMGRESAGVPEDVHARCDARLRIPLRDGFRSLNVAVAAGIALSEALRQIKGFPGEAGQDHEPPMHEKLSA